MQLDDKIMHSVYMVVLRINIIYTYVSDND
jgi:hypothetical protein